MHADKENPVDAAEAGNIYTFVGLKNVTTGDTLCDEKSPISLESMTFPDPVIEVAVEPIPSIPKALRNVDVTTGEAAQAINQRSDNTAVPAAAVVAEAMVRLTIAQYVLEKFGGDSVAETKRNAESYVASWPEHMR